MAWLKKLTSAWDSMETSREAHGDLESVKQASRSFFQAASRKVEGLKQAASQRTEQAAGKFAEACSEWTGREMTTADVKRSAKIGAAIGAVLTAGPVAAVALRQARAAGLASSPTHPGGADNQGTADGLLPSAPSTDPTQAWEQDDIEYDQRQYEHLQDHFEQQDQLNDVVEDQISYNMDIGFDGDF